MTNPGGPDAFNLGPVQKAVSIFGAGGNPAADGTLSQLSQWDQGTIETLLKQLYVKDNAGINGPLGLVYSGLRQGISLPLAILEALINRLMGTAHLFLSVEHALSFAKQVPVLGDIVRIVESVLTTAPSVAKAIIRLITRVPVSALTDATPNLVPDGSFDEIPTGEEGRWFHSDTVGKKKPGASGIVGTGEADAIVNQPVAVASGQTFRVSGWVSWDSAAGDADSVRLTLIEYADEAPKNTVVIGAVTPVGTSDWVELAADYTVPDGVDMVAVVPDVTDGFTSGTAYFDDVTGFGTGKIQQSWVANLPESLQDLWNFGKLIISTVVGALGGVGEELEDLAEALLHIPASVVKGVLGATSIDETIVAVVNAFVGGMVGAAGTGATPADAFNVAKMISEWANRGKKAKEVTDTRTNTSATGGLGRSERSNFDLGLADTWLTVTPTASVIAFDYVEGDMPLGAISWIGYGVSGITAVYVNAWKVDFETKAITWQHSSENVVGIISGAGSAAPGIYVQYQLPEPVDLKISDLFGYEVIVVGGTHHIRGRVYDLPAHPTAPIAKFAATRDASASPSTPPSSIARADINWSDNAPWIGIAVDTGNGDGHRDPEWRYLGTTATTIPVPVWCARVIAVALGDGGGGHLGGSWGFAGNPGEPGEFAVAVWDRDTHFTGTGTIVSLDPGPGGTAGSSPLHQNGGNGEGTTLSIPGYSVTAGGGKGATGIRNVLLGLPKPVGRGPGDPSTHVFTYEDFEFTGGSDQNDYSGAGVAPGGAGNGGNWSTVTAGGRGAPGGGWVVFLPGAPVGAALPPPPVVNVPPPPPVISLAEATFSSITLSLSPGVVSGSAMRVRSVGKPKLKARLSVSGSAMRVRSVGKPTITPALPPPTYGAVGAGVSGAGIPAAFNFTAPAGADVYIAVTTDRPAGNITGAKLGATTNNTPIATAYHDNVTTWGATKVYKFSGAGTGSPQSVQALGSGTAWWMVDVIAINGVHSVGTPIVVTGNGTAVAQSIPSGFGIQIIGAGAGGGSATAGAFSAFTGVTNRVNRNAQGSSQAISTSTASASMTATISQSTPWAAIYIPLR